MKLSSRPGAGFRIYLLPLLLWLGSAESPEPPSTEAATGDRGVLAPLVEVALPSAPSLRPIGPQGAEAAPAGSSGPPSALPATSAFLHRPGAALDPHLHGAVPPHLACPRHRPRGPPSTLG